MSLVVSPSKVPGRKRKASLSEATTSPKVPRASSAIGEATTTSLHHHSLAEPPLIREPDIFTQEEHRVYDIQLQNKISEMRTPLNLASLLTLLVCTTPKLDRSLSEQRFMEKRLQDFQPFMDWLEACLVDALAQKSFAVLRELSFLQHPNIHILFRELGIAMTVADPFLSFVPYIQQINDGLPNAIVLAKTASFSKTLEHFPEFFTHQYMLFIRRNDPDLRTSSIRATLCDRWGFMFSAAPVPELSSDWKEAIDLVRFYGSAPKDPSCYSLSHLYIGSVILARLMVLIQFIDETRTLDIVTRRRLWTYVQTYPGLAFPPHKPGSVDLFTLLARDLRRWPTHAVVDQVLVIQKQVHAALKKIDPNMSTSILVVIDFPQAGTEVDKDLYSEVARTFETLCPYKNGLITTRFVGDDTLDFPFPELPIHDDFAE